MIEVSFTTLVCICLGLMMVPIFCAWLMAECSRQRRERAAFRHVLRCKLCAAEFADSTAAELPHCPHCGALNERPQLPRF